MFSRTEVINFDVGLVSLEKAGTTGEFLAFFEPPCPAL